MVWGEDGLALFEGFGCGLRSSDKLGGVRESPGVVAMRVCDVVEGRGL